jgi:acyl-coenzyme A thioesterase PaaI-like protein
MSNSPIQNFYPEDASICFGCGRNNTHGLHIQTFWDGEEGIAHFTPQPFHTGWPGVVYGGLLASLIDCHSIGTSIAAMYQMEGRALGSDPQIQCVTGTLHVVYLYPTPIDANLLLRARVKELTPRKAIIETTVTANDQVCVRAEIVAVRIKQD